MCSPPSADHFVVLRVGLLLEAGEDRVPFGALGLSEGSGLQRVRILVLLLQMTSLVMNSALPPSRMSVPRPAMLVETVTAPLRPACATMSASRS